ncbi:MAG: methyltransferase domain-containing protein [Candidatus Omnitrophica bacterium]|nr:methyltransferase domain-containing protein [Candidatus Omnitrophota bacterium]
MKFQPGTLKIKRHRRRSIETAYSFYAARTLQTAAELRLFERFGKKTFTARAAAGIFKADLRGMTVFLDALAALGCLRKQGERYRNTPENLAVHSAGSELYIGDSLRLQGASWDGWGRLKQIILSGKPAVAPPFRSRDRSAVRDFARHNTAAGHAPELARGLGLRGTDRLLDLGCGPGTFSAYFLKQYPLLRATLFDLPATLRETRSLLRRYRLGGRVRFQAGDFLKDPIPVGHDAVFLSHIVHGLNENDNRKLLRKVFAAMEPGGRIFIQDFFLEPDRAAPEFAALFSLNMLVHTPGGRSYSFDETAEWLRAAGFRRVRKRPQCYPRSIRILEGTR